MPVLESHAQNEWARAAVPLRKRGIVLEIGGATHERDKRCKGGNKPLGDRFPSA
jgi:hypothetical protein